MKTVRIPLLYLYFNGVKYGAGGCNVFIGKDRMDAVAVAAQCGATSNEERHITTEKGAQTWLHQRGLPLMIAWGLVNEVRKGVKQ